MGHGVKRAREQAGLSAAKLEERTRELGYPVTRGTIAKIEGGHREGKFDVNEVVVLATALGVAPLDIVFPTKATPVEYLPGRTIPTGEALVNFSASQALELSQLRQANLKVFERNYEKFLAVYADVNRDLSDVEDQSRLGVEILVLGTSAERLQANWAELRQIGLVEGEDPFAPDYAPAIENMRERRAIRDQRALRDG